MHFGVVHTSNTEGVSAPDGLLKDADGCRDRPRPRGYGAPGEMERQLRCLAIGVCRPPGSKHENHCKLLIYKAKKTAFIAISPHNAQQCTADVGKVSETPSLDLRAYIRALPSEPQLLSCKGDVRQDFLATEM